MKKKKLFFSVFFVLVAFGVLFISIFLKVIYLLMKKATLVDINLIVGLVIN